MRRKSTQNLKIAIDNAAKINYNGISQGENQYLKGFSQENGGVKIWQP